MTIPTPMGDQPQHSPSSAGAADSAPHTPSTEKKHAIRVGTIVWGAFFVAAAVLIIAVSTGAQIDAELTLIIGLAVAGLALVIGSILAGLRRNRRQQHQPH